MRKFIVFFLAKKDSGACSFSCEAEAANEEGAKIKAASELLAQGLERNDFNAPVITVVRPVINQQATVKSEVADLVTTLTLLSVEAPKNEIDVTVTVASHVKSVVVMVVLDCTSKMYADGKQPEPYVYVDVDLLAHDAESILRGAVMKIQYLLLKHRELKAVA